MGTVSARACKVLHCDVMYAQALKPRGSKRSSRGPGNLASRRRGSARLALPLPNCTNLKVSGLYLLVLQADNRQTELVA